MQTWAKRGIQSAFVTGGLLMLGTGIASAQENVNPDAAPPAVDAGVAVPVKVDQNNIGTPVKNVDTPKIDREISTDRVTSAVPTRFAPATNPLIRTAGGHLHDAGLTRGNTVDAHLAVPIHFCGNAIALGGDAYAAGDCDSQYHREGGVVTDGAGQPLAGNIIVADHVLPVQITGNAITAGGNAETNTKAKQEATTGGDYRTSGKEGVLSGNGAISQGAIPTQVTGTAAGAGGIAKSKSEADTKAVSDGSLKTTGEGGTLSGNVVAAAFAPLFEVNGNSTAAASNTSTDSTQSGTAIAGGKHTGINNIDTWIETAGGRPSSVVREDDAGSAATASGSVVQPQLAGPVTVDDNAGAVGGNSQAKSATTNKSNAGGFTSTSGQGSTGSGTVADAPASLPVSGAGNGVGALGNAKTDHANKVDSTAGSGTYTNGDDSVLSANTATAGPNAAPDVCGNSAASGGQANSNCTNDVTSTTGDYNGTTGNNSVISGNIGQVPAAVPVDGSGTTTPVIGQTSSTVTGTKDVHSGGTGNTQDDRGTGSSSVVTTPTALAPQAFGDSAGVVGNSLSDVKQDTTAVAGGDSQATGKKSSLSGTIAQVPTSTPAQVFGNGATVIGNNDAAADNTTDMQAGGDASTTGEQGSIAGTIASVPAGSGTQVQGQSVGTGSNVNATSVNDLTSHAGGNATSNGDGGALSGNLAAVPATPFTPTPANTVSGAGITNSDATTATDVVAGGDSTTSAEDASISGILTQAAVNPQAGPYGDAVAAAGKANTVTDKTSFTQAGGATDTSGYGPMAAGVINVPVEATAKVKEVTAEVVGQATTQVTEDDNQVTGNEVRSAGLKGIELPKGVDHLAPANEVPNLSALKKLPVNQQPTQSLSLPQQRQATPVQGISPSQLPPLPVAAPALPLAQGRSIPATPKLPLDGPASLNGLHLNPASDLQAPKARNLPVNAPALNTLNTAKAFQPTAGLL